MTPGDLRTIRQRLGLSQAQLALELQVPADTLAKWERGDMTIRHPRVLFLALERLEHVPSNGTPEGARGPETAPEGVRKVSD